MTTSTTPNGWAKARIADVASVSRGASPRPIASDRWFSADSNVGWVRIADLGRSDGLTLKTTTQRLSADGIARSRYLEPGTLIMSIAATVGLPIITGIPTCIHDGFVALEKLRDIDRTFLLYLLKSLESDLRSAGQTGSQANVNTKIVNNLSIPLPPLPEQRRIAQILIDTDHLIATLGRLIVKKQAIKQGLVQQVLTSNTPSRGSTTEWSRFRVADVVTARFSGPSPTCDERNVQGQEWGVLKTTCSTWQHGWDPTKHKVLPESFWGNKRIEVRVGDTIITKAGPRHRVGVPAYVSSINPHIVPSGKMICLRPHKQIVVPGFLTLALTDKRTQTYLDQRTTGMAESQVNFENRDLLGAPVWLPQLSVQRKLLEPLEDTDEQITNIKRRLEKARFIKQGILQELLTGRTRLTLSEAQS